MKEIVTIQVGNYANFVGSHFWNFQDELLGLADSSDSDQIFRHTGLNMDILYRTGETQQGILTYTPRLVSMDFQGSLGSVSSHGTLYNDVPDKSLHTSTWTGPVSTHTSQPLKKNLFLQSMHNEEGVNSGSPRGCESANNNSHVEVQDKDIVECLENEVVYWTDFSKVHYHPRSLYEPSGLWSDVKDFNNYGIGREAFSAGLRAADINERLRFFVEECDFPQGFQLIVDDSGGFSGVAGEFLENIADEYTNIPVLLYSVRSPEFCLDRGSKKWAISRKIHDAVSFSKLSAFCKLIVPLGLPSLNVGRMSKYLYLEDERPYHTSSVYASAIHSVSLPMRMQSLGPSAQSSFTSGAFDMKELVQILAGGARQNMVPVLEVSMPAPAFTGNIVCGSTVPFSGMQAQQTLLENLQPLHSEIAEDFEDMQALEAMIVHGAFASGCRRASISEVKDAVLAAYDANTMQKKPRFSHISIAQCPLPIPLPFPSIFKNHVGRNGELLDNLVSDPSLRKGSLEVHSVPMAARLRSSNAILPFLEKRLESLRKFGMCRGALGIELLKSWGFEREDVEDMGETLSGMVTALNPFSQLSSDSD